MSLGKAFFIMNTLMMRTVRVVKITIATRRKVQVKKMKVLTLKRRRYSMHIAVLSYFYWFFSFFSDLLLLFLSYKKRLPHSIYDTNVYVSWETPWVCSFSVEGGTRKNRFLMSMGNSIMLNFSIAAKSIQFVGKKYRASDFLKKKETKRVTWYIVVKNNNKEKIANTLKCSWK